MNSQIFFFKVFIYLILAVLDLRCCSSFSLAAVHRLLIATASLVAEHGLQKTASIVVHGLCCPVACGIFPDQGSNLCLLHWQVDSLRNYVLEWFVMQQKLTDRQIISKFIKVVRYFFFFHNYCTKLANGKKIKCKKRSHLQQQHYQQHN